MHLKPLKKKVYNCGEKALDPSRMTIKSGLHAIACLFPKIEHFPMRVLEHKTLLIPYWGVKFC